MAHSREEALSPRGMEGRCGSVVPMVQGEGERNKAARITSAEEPGNIKEPPYRPDRIERNPPPTP